jgi:hypothetical protein
VSTFAHTVEVYVERGEAELTFPVRVTLTGIGPAAECEFEWLDGEPADDELARAEENAREKFLDWAREQPTAQDYAEEAADRAYDERKDDELFGRPC